MWLDVDYHPDRLLWDTLLAAGIDKNVADMSALPLKTHMKVSARRVLLKAGYGAGYKEIHGPMWGSSYDEYQEYDRKMWDTFDRCCRKPWEEDIQARYGKEWTYDQLHAAGEPQRPVSSNWQGPV